MSFFSFLYRNAFWTAPPMFLAGGVLLACLILSLVGMVRRSRLVTLPLVPQQAVHFAAAGRVVLCTEGPILSRRFSGLNYELAEDGRPVASRPVVLRSRSSGFSSARMEARVFVIPGAGQYTLSVKGIPADTRADAEHKLVFMKPHFGKTVLHIIGMIAAGTLVIGGIVLFGLRMASPEGGWELAKRPVLLYGGLVGFAALVAGFSVVSKKQERAEKQFALSQGWTYSESYADSQGQTKDLAASLETVCPVKEFRVGNNMVVESGNRTVRLFKCAYRQRDWGPKLNEGFGCLVQSERFKPVTAQVQVSGKSPFDRVLLKNQVDMGNSEFGRNFIVVSEDVVAANTILSDRVKSLLVDANHENPDFRELCLGPGGFVIITRRLSPKEWPALANFAKKLESGWD